MVVVPSSEYMVPEMVIPDSCQQAPLPVPRVESLSTVTASEPPSQAEYETVT